jgi:hypothetical protein
MIVAAMARTGWTNERATVWAGRAAWAALPFAAGPALGRAVTDWAAAARTTATVGLWAVWAVVLVATLVPHPIALTTWRVAAPAALAAAALAAAGGEVSWPGLADAAAAVALAFTPDVAASCVNGPAYPNERRFPLRPAAVAFVGPALLAWVAVVGAPAAAALLLAQQRWIAGAVVLLGGGGAAVLGARALHGLSRRWLVFVPAGIVVHDPLTLADPTLFQRHVIDSLGPAAAAADDRIDVTAGALGLALDLRFREPTDVLVISKPGRRPTAESVATTRLAIAPTRPAAVLAEAESRGYAIG